MTEKVKPQVGTEYLTDFNLKLVIEYSDPKEAGRIYGELLDLEHRGGNKYYAVDSADFEINFYDEAVYTLKVNLGLIPNNKIQKILEVLLEEETPDVKAQIENSLKEDQSE